MHATSPQTRRCKFTRLRRFLSRCEEDMLLLRCSGPGVSPRELAKALNGLGRQRRTLHECGCIFCNASRTEATPKTSGEVFLASETAVLGGIVAGHFLKPRA